ncbi:MAG: transposase [Ferruginibacter sp.]|nr:transposase [Ferruginibacter sp.]
MSGKYKPADDQLPHFVTLTAVDWVDVFTRNMYKDIFLESIRYCVKIKAFA